MKLMELKRKKLDLKLNDEGNNVLKKGESKEEVKEERCGRIRQEQAAVLFDLLKCSPVPEN